MKGPLSKRCEGCKEEFTCGQYGCWCAQFGITEWQMDWIAERFQDCLCKDCLGKVPSGDLLNPQRRDA